MTDVDDPDNLGRVRIRPDPDWIEDKDDEREWLPWITPYAGRKGGVVFLPEKDDPAQLLLSCGRGAAFGAIRSEKLPEEARDPAVKYIGNNFDERIIWKEKLLEVRSGENYLTISPEEVRVKLDKVDLKIDKENLTAKLGGKLDLAVDKSVAIKGGEELRLDSEKIGVKASGDAGVNAGKNLRLDASDIVAMASGTAKIGGRVELG